MAAVQLSQLVDISKPQYILTEIKKLFTAHYKSGEFSALKQSFFQIRDLFSGKMKGYRECNTEYHDLRHTLDTFLAVARLIDGYNLTEKKFDVQKAENLLKAALFHDTGYIQEEWDTSGTGAKYTQEHVNRSTHFVEKNAKQLELDSNDVESINSYIICSHLGTDFEVLSFASGIDRIAGAILGTSDLLGQMSDRIYLEKLLFLYYEFREASIPGYDTEFDIIRKTLDFYEVVKQRLQTTFFNIFNHAQTHFQRRYDINRNLYIDAMENNIKYVKKIIQDESTNFRDKLHRVNFK
ncbi:MAG: hypothetical protein JW822_01165 [Spirochaetales bacterium]|nr:hypothetical protein [Spirochaetales bacterium]